MGETEKTNAMRILEASGIGYTPHSYPHGGEAVDGVTVARLTGRDPAQVFKTLVTEGAPGKMHVFVIPVAKELDLKEAARATGEKSVQMLHVKDLLRVTGYVRGGCSPVGMKKTYPTVIDEDCLYFDTILVSGGRIGLQIELSPEDLKRITGGTIAPVSREA